MIRSLLDLIRHTRCRACAHLRADHWIPFTTGRPCSRCSCGGFR